MPAIGLPGRVWSSREPIYISYVATMQFRYARRSPRAKVACSIRFSDSSGQGGLGSDGVFSREIRQPDRDLLDMMAALGAR